MSAILGAVISAAASYLSSRLASSNQVSSSKDLMNYQNQLNNQNWDKYNEYNSPLNQVNRLKEAGLNPALATSDGITNVAQSAPSSTGIANTPKDDYEDKMQKGMSLFTQAKQQQNISADTLLKQKQADLSHEQAKSEENKRNNLDADSALKRVTTLSHALDNAIKEKASPDIIANYHQQLLNAQATYDKIVADTDSAIEDTNLKKIQANHDTYEVNVLQPLRAKLLDAEISRENSQTLLNSAMAENQQELAEQVRQMTPKQVKQLDQAMNIARAKLGVDAFNVACGHGLLGQLARLGKRSPEQFAYAIQYLGKALEEYKANPQLDKKGNLILQIPKGYFQTF